MPDRSGASSPERLAGRRDQIGHDALGLRERRDRLVAPIPPFLQQPAGRFGRECVFHARHRERLFDVAQLQLQAARLGQRDFPNIRERRIGVRQRGDRIRIDHGIAFAFEERYGVQRLTVAREQLVEQREAVAQALRAALADSASHQDHDEPDVFRAQQQREAIAFGLRPVRGLRRFDELAILRIFPRRDRGLQHHERRIVFEVRPAGCVRRDGLEKIRIAQRGGGWGGIHQ